MLAWVHCIRTPRWKAESTLHEKQNCAYLYGTTVEIKYSIFTIGNTQRDASAKMTLNMGKMYDVMGMCW